MITEIKIIAFTLFCIVSYIYAGVPIRSYGYETMGMEYSFLSRGQTIRAEYSDFYETLHMLNLCYSPFEFVRFTVGFGADKYKVVEEKKSVFNGNYGFSPGFKLNLFSPQIAGKVIRFTSQFEFLYINSYDQFDNNYKSILFNPGGGIIIHIG
ncbi:MAG: hypothetical protein PVI26_10260, partial [Chitinispirillia bacterium]